jgi:hypothetical protein
MNVDAERHNKTGKHDTYTDVILLKKRSIPQATYRYPSDVFI